MLMLLVSLIDNRALSFRNKECYQYFVKLRNKNYILELDCICPRAPGD